MPRHQSAPADQEERVSLHPFSAEEVMAGLLGVDPDDLSDEREPEQPKSA